jgi:hypothetical protein
MMGEADGWWHIPLGFVLVPTRDGGTWTAIYTLSSFPMDLGRRGYAAPIEDEL